MMPILTSAQMRHVDQLTIEFLGVPARVLMETAGRGVAAQVRRHTKPGSRIAIICGTGNNGGDGLVAARALLDEYDVITIVIGTAGSLKPDANANYEALDKLLNAGRKVRFLVGDDEARTEVRGLQNCAVIVDALFGIGLNKELTGTARAAVEAINALQVPVLSVDVPSGLDADTGRTMGACVQATWTVALGALKRGHALVPGAERCGDVTIVDIGIPTSFIDSIPGVCRSIDEKDMRALHRPRSMGAHKGSAGHVGVIGGSAGMQGAPIMTTHGALRAGAGRVTLFSAVRFHPSGLPVEATMSIGEAGTEPDRARDAGMDALVIGPGLATDDEGDTSLDAVIQSDLPLVLDAGALRLIEGDLMRLRERKAPTVLTPHPAELGRLLGISTADVQNDRISAARSAAELSGAIVINKGARSVVVQPNGQSAVSLIGHPVLATGGTGDVLAGVIATLLAKGLSAWDAARLGVALHARAGELCSTETGPEGVLATEVSDMIPRVFRELERA